MQPVFLHLQKTRHAIVSAVLVILITHLVMLTLHRNKPNTTIIREHLVTTTKFAVVKHFIGNKLIYSLPQLPPYSLSLTDSLRDLVSLPSLEERHGKTSRSKI